MRKHTNNNTRMFDWLVVEPTPLKKYESNWVHLPQFSGWKKILELPPPSWDVCCKKIMLQRSRFLIQLRYCILWRYSLIHVRFCWCIELVFYEMREFLGKYDQTDQTSRSAKHQTACISKNSSSPPCLSSASFPLFPYLTGTNKTMGLCWASKWTWTWENLRVRLFLKGV